MKLNQLCVNDVLYILHKSVEIICVSLLPILISCVLYCHGSALPINRSLCAQVLHKAVMITYTPRSSTELSGLPATPAHHSWGSLGKVNQQVLQGWLCVLFSSIYPIIHFSSTFQLYRLTSMPEYFLFGVDIWIKLRQVHQTAMYSWNSWEYLSLKEGNHIETLLQWETLLKFVLKPDSSRISFLSANLPQIILSLE